MDSGKVAAYQDKIGQFCQSWPESEFYFKQLSSYVNITPRKTALGIRAFQLVKPSEDEHNTSGLKEISFPVGTTANLDVLFPSLVIVEGHLCPEAVVALGLHFNNIRPEFFLGHLELERVRNLHSRTSYELPALPSRRGNIVHIRLVSLWRSNASAGIPKNLEPGERVTVDKSCRHYESQLFDSERAHHTRFRKVHLHNSKHFTVEQTVSLFVVPRDKQTLNWRCEFEFILILISKTTKINTHITLDVYLLDSGQALPGRGQYPWNESLGYSGYCPTQLKAIRYNEPRAAIGVVNSDAGLQQNEFLMHPYHPLKDFVVTNGYKRLSEPFFALASVLSAAARSWNQVLNFIEEDIASHQDAPAGTVHSSLTQIRFNSGVIQRFQGFIQQDEQILETVQDGAWTNGIASKQDEEDNLREEQNVMLKELLGDYKGLLTRCQLLSQQCESASNILQSAVALLESQKSIKQTEEVNKLTKLAFVFVPVSLIASIFGMNVSEINSENAPKLWHFLLTSILVLLPCLYLSSGRQLWASSTSHGAR